jgi:putative ABC transport system ATP-binding protein
MIRIEELNKTYKTAEVETLALHQINLHIKEQDFVSIMGPSGCGKSTLLNILGLIDRCSTGKYFYLGKQVQHLSARQRSEIRKKTIGFIFQSFNLIDELNVYENVELPLIYQKIAASERKKKVNAVLEQLNLINRSRSFPQQLSGGQQQKVAICRAIVTKPALLLADEPTGNLDSGHGKEVMQILTQLNAEGTTIIMATHSDLIAQYSHKKITLFDGRILSESNIQASVISSS